MWFSLTKNPTSVFGVPPWRAGNPNYGYNYGESLPPDFCHVFPRKTRRKKKGHQTKEFTNKALERCLSRASRPAKTSWNTLGGPWGPWLEHRWYFPLSVLNNLKWDIYIYIYIYVIEYIFRYRWFSGIFCSYRTEPLTVITGIITPMRLHMMLFR